MLCDKRAYLCSDASLLRLAPAMWVADPVSLRRNPDNKAEFVTFDMTRDLPTPQRWDVHADEHRPVKRWMVAIGRSRCNERRRGRIETFTCDRQLSQRLLLSTVTLLPPPHLLCVAFGIVRQSPPCSIRTQRRPQRLSAVPELAARRLRRPRRGRHERRIGGVRDWARIGHRHLRAHR